MRGFRLISVLLLTFVSAAFAQHQRQNDSPCDLTVRVRTAQDRTFDTPLQVELLSPQGTPMMAVHVSGESPAQFQVMPANTYRLRVSGVGVETTTTDPIYIEEWEHNHTETINVNLIDTSEQRKAASGADGSPTVSLAEMNIPSKAREELQKGTEAFTKGDMKKAQEHFEKAAAIYPQYARAYTNLGVIAIKDGNRAKAREMFSKSISVDEGFLPGYVNLARMDFQDHDYRECETLLQKVMSVNPSMTDAVALLASAEYVNKEYDKALADALRVHRLANHEQFADVHLIAGQVYEMQNRPQDALVQYQLFLKESPNSPRVPMVQKQVAQLQAGSN
jgi:Tfp pilus assembly protein PilF